MANGTIFQYIPHLNRGLVKADDDGKIIQFIQVRSELIGFGNDGVPQENDSITFDVYDNGCEVTAINITKA